jgi:ArsR family transcriptional regulator, lead/cadmium/zinc/bismuth-responsive transcriptional repressor
MSDPAEPSCSLDDHGSPSSPVASEAALEKASRLFRALGDQARLRLVSRLAQRELCVTELSAAEGEALSTISQRLRILRGENIVVGKRRGKHINYALVDRHVVELVANALAHTEEPEETES